MSARPREVVIREVGLRDGLQSIATILPTERKREWLRDAYAAGQREIEVGSFVPARLLPQLGDTDEVLALRAKVADWLAGEVTHGTLWRAGLPKTFNAARPATAAAAAA